MEQKYKYIKGGGFPHLLSLKPEASTVYQVLFMQETDTILLAHNANYRTKMRFNLADHLVREYLANEGITDNPRILEKWSDQDLHSLSQIDFAFFGKVPLDELNEIREIEQNLRKSGINYRYRQ